MKVVLTSFAETQLSQVFSYYSENVSLSVADKILSELYYAIEKLENYPNLGTKEPMLKKTGIDYKYLVAGNYKILFAVRLDEISVTDIFDTRQNPEKLSERNK